MYALGGVEFRLMAITVDYSPSATAILSNTIASAIIRYRNIRTQIAQQLKSAFEDEYKSSGALTKSLGEVTKCRKEE